jgi:lipoate-protein ligase A
MSLPAEDPRDALDRDEALLDSLAARFALSHEVHDVSSLGTSAPSFAETPRLVRWWTAASPVVVVGLGMHHRLASIVDAQRCREAGVQILARRAGGGALLLDEHMVCGAICLPRETVPEDVTESYRWLGDLLTSGLHAAGIDGARRIDTDEARQDVATLKSRKDEVAKILLTTCYGALSPHEVAIGNAKLVGLAQIRRRQAALFQFGILLHDQSPLADFLHVPDEIVRAELREELKRRTIGVDLRVQTDELLQWPR